MDVHARGLTLGGIEHVDVPRLLVHHGAASGVEALDVEVGVMCKLGDLPAGTVVLIQIHRPVSVRQKVDAVAKPDRVEVVRALPGDLLQGVVLQVENPDGLGLAAAVATPLHVDQGDVLIGEPASVRREGTGEPTRNRELVRKTSVDRDPPEVAVRDGGVRSARPEDHVVPARGPADDVVGHGVPRQPARRPALDRHDVDIRVPLVLRTEREHAPVR